MICATHLILNKSLMQIFTKIINPPPPIPCITRPANNILMLLAIAQIKLPTRNTMLATSRTGLRPKMSLIFPHVGVDAAAASK